MSDISNYEDIMDSRDIIERIGEIEPWHVEWTEAPETAVSLDVASFATRDDADAYLAESEDRDALEVVEYEDEADELKTLTELVEELRQSSGDSPEDGITLIRDSYFKDYAIQFAEDIGAIEDDARWPATCIDWDKAADELQMDYTSVQFGDVTYWVR